jgi:hypothetical protein
MAIDTTAVLKVAPSFTLTMLMEHDHQKSGDIISEAKAQGMVLGLINAVLALTDNETAEAAVQVGKINFEREIKERGSGGGQQPAHEVLALELPDRRDYSWLTD